MFVLPYLLGFVAIGMAFTAAPTRLIAGVAGSAVIAAIITGVLDAYGIIAVAVLFGLAALASLERSQGILRVENLGLLLLLLLGVALALHSVPGFNNPLVVPETRLSPDAIAYRVYWNFDKLMAGLALMLVIRQRRDLAVESRVRVNPLLVGLATIVIVLGLGWAIGMVRLDPKLPTLLAWWIPSNLFITSVAEEAFFRGILLALALKGLAKVVHGKWIALVLVSAVFGVAHIAGGVTYVVLSSVAGLGYGLVYLATGRLAWSVGLHFCLNLVHVLLFTYPMLSA